MIFQAIPIAMLQMENLLRGEEERKRSGFVSVFFLFAWRAGWCL